VRYPVGDEDLLHFAAEAGRLLTRARTAAVQRS
jgi:hypothetical protein